MYMYPHVMIPPYIVTITIDAIKTVVVKIYDRDRAELHGAEQKKGNFLPSLMYGVPLGKASRVKVDVHSGNVGSRPLD